MEYVILIIGILIVLIIKSIFDEKKRRVELIQKLKKEWGQVPEQEYTSEKLKALQWFYNQKKEVGPDVDDITWNDLDMDQIYMMMNNTVSSIGEEYLYYILRKLKFDQKELVERNELIKFFERDKEARLKLQVIFHQMGKVKKLSIFEYLHRVSQLERESNLSHYLLSLGLIGSIIAVAFVGPGAILAIIMFLAINILQYYKKKAEIDPYITVFSYIIKLLDSIEELSELDAKELEKYKNQLKEGMKEFKSFRKNTFLLSAGNQMSGSLVDMLLDYLRMLFHVDLIKFNNMVGMVKKNRELLYGMFETIGLLDSMLAVASFRQLMGDTCEPILMKDKRPSITVEDLYHPLIDDPVKNSIKANGCVLITGSNASGKSTFIKTMAINAILSQTIYTSLSKYYKGNFFKVYSSMALKDDLSSNESYYIVEIKSLKRILDNLEQEIPVLCFVDEVLRGTNTLERIAASAQILKSFATSNAICFAATHDIELTHILEHFYTNYHFQEQIKDDNIIFDYQLIKGRAVSKNAIKLLSIIGYSNDIIDKANKEANAFLTDGSWRVL